MSIRLYRRHKTAGRNPCPHRSKGQYFTGCNCPIWVVGEIDEREVRYSLKLSDWNTAVRRIEEIEADPAAAAAAGITIPNAIAAYLADCGTRLQPSTVARHQQVFDALQKFAAGYNLKTIDQLTLRALTDYRATRGLAITTQRMEIKTLRAFCRWCENLGWLKGNPAKKIIMPRDTEVHTLPFGATEVTALLAACDKLTNPNPVWAERARIRAKAMLLFLLYSGFRISDVAQLERGRIQPDGRLFLRNMQKTQVPVYARLPQPVLEALAALPVESPRYYFMSGRGKLAGVTNSMRRTVGFLGAIAGIDAHPHRFRDTFACQLLENGVEMRTVQILLGHRSIKTTEEHYAPFLLSHQRRLDEALCALDFQGPSFPESRLRLVTREPVA